MKKHSSAQTLLCLIVVINLLNSLGCLISLFRIIVKTTVKMGPSRTNSTSTNPAKKDEGSNHLVECTGPGSDGSGCVIGTNNWVPMLIPKNFFSRPFLCGFCAVEELKKNQCSAAGDLSPVIEADSIEQYGRRENVRIFGVVEEPGEDVFAKVVSVAEKAGV